MTPSLLRIPLVAASLVALVVTGCGARTVLRDTNDGGVVNAAFRLGNVFATQFHPEKSGESGLALLTNFVRMVATVPA